ncbi:Hypothetical predicted protein [Cloeon dipterum]|uniref:C-type lectin domain-containing protein n=1 Tax=Cloeon dipterum TaxID=197152 RepID=A0A8S1E6P9_9INSE|nr:Hypothetical predicted protein [Cloeon dipterum]
MVKAQFALLVLLTIYFATDVWSATTRKRRPRTTTTVAKPIRRMTTTKRRPTPPNTDSSYPFCRNYNQIKRKLLEITYSDDFVVGKRTLLAELLDPKPIPQGSFSKRGNRVFFESIEKVDYKTAVESCQYRKLQLLALDTPGEINNQFFTSNWTVVDYMHHNDSAADMEFLWTSAVPCSKSDPLNKTTNSCSSVTWCSSKVETRLDYTLNLGQFSPPYCLIYKRSTKQLVPTNCSFGSFFMCELPCSKPICPPEKMCIKDESIFEVVDGKTYMKPGREIRGKWEKSKFNSSYYFFLGEKLVTWTENWKTCCSLGLKPLSLGEDITHFDRSKSPMQGVVYWTAMTRAECPYQFENCFQENKEEFPMPIYGTKEGGSCVAISVRDDVARATIGTGMAVKVIVCTSKLLMACEGPTQTFEVRENIVSCDTPECSGIPDCVMDDSKFLTRPVRVLLNPSRYGRWSSSCDMSFLQLNNELGTWDEAYKRCCSHGMDLMSIQNSNQQNCLYKPPTISILSNNGRLPYNGHIWTSGRDVEACRGRLRWCTGYLNDYIKKDVVWKKGVDPKSANNSCVYIDFDDPDLPSLGLADCSEKKQIVCEAPGGVGYKSQMHLFFCRKSFKVTQSEAGKIWNTGDISQAGYGFKKMVQCLAEYLGLVYDSTKINEHVYLSMMSRMFFPFDRTEMLNSVRDKREWLMSQPTLNSTRSIMKFISEATEDTMDDFFSGHFQLAAEMIRKIYDCRDIAKTNEETFAFDFLQCLVQSERLNRFWNAYNFELERPSVIPLVDEFFSPCSTFQNFLQNTSFCMRISSKFLQNPN